MNMHTRLETLQEQLNQQATQRSQLEMALAQATAQYHRLEGAIALAREALSANGGAPDAPPEDTP